ncbi:MAG: serine/threonine protein kinase [Sedimentisphaerales bacterium]|nr:serine/threonine protein kinase [Sedimentisphaerales bacterium]
MKPPPEDNPYQMPTASGFGPEGSGLGAVPEVTGYEILGVLDEGGMGVVYLARQTHPIRRRVAMKVIKPGMDSRQVLARFETERQALALLDHPNIAQVHDAGATRDGRPYFAMEYVKGLPITDYCDREKLELDERLSLFKHVCEAVQHAHQKGIIHRDIKPSNLLVYTEGNEAIVKIIDFGVAKAIGPSLTGGTLYSEAGQFVGTPEYMSPEQADMASQDIDTRSDIYSLGAVLYELLTGVLPFESETLREGGIEHIRHVIRDENPKTPSTRLTSLGQRAASVAQNRRTQVGTLARRLHKELEWIPLKAMRKERSRRYRSAAELADDIQNYLDGAPLSAGPESTLYLVRKFVARNRALVAGVATVLLVLIAGVVVSTYFAICAESARIEAQAVSNFLRYDLLTSVSGGDPNATVRSILDTGTQRLEGKYPGQPLVEAWLRQTLGCAYLALGLDEKAQSHLTRARDIYQDRLGAESQATSACLIDLGWVYFRQGQYDRATGLLMQAKNIRQRMGGREHSDVLKLLILLGRGYHRQGLLEQAAAQFQEALETDLRILGRESPNRVLCMSLLADVRRDQKRYKDAERLCEDVLSICHHNLGEKSPHTLEAKSKLAIVYINQERYLEAEPLCRTALETCREVLDADAELTVILMNNLGRICKEQKHYDEALKLLLEAAERHTLLEGKPNPVTVDHLIDIYTTLGQSEEAEKWRAKRPEMEDPNEEK